MSCHYMFAPECVLPPLQDSDGKGPGKKFTWHNTGLEAPFNKAK